AVEQVLMLILDVATRWSSTHQMLCRTLDFRDIIDSYVSRICELQDFELSDADWKAIELVTRWLKTFRSATTQMSTTKISMLSTTHAIFWGLQDHLKKVLRSLPDGISPRLRDGVIAAHEKLSEYYYKYDESPLYTWAA
ncbi:hypothetical protein ARMSODRAFT_839521, partial [Armillaria solidipes]